MKRQLFSEGEEVILDSQYMPRANGEYVVLSAKYGLSRHIITGDIDVLWVYDLGLGILFNESALRKKYPPSDDTFDELVKKLKAPHKDTA